METAAYATLTRQSGLTHELQAIANNIANASTVGFRREGVVFSEHVTRLDKEPALSMAHGNGRFIDQRHGNLMPTGGTFDLGIDGDGYFLIDSAAGQVLTRAGNFTSSAEGILVSSSGYPVLDAGGSPIRIPETAKQILVSSDGTLSADGLPFAQMALWAPDDPSSLRHVQGTAFLANSYRPMEEARIVQGFLENSNVDPVIEIARMIEVQRTYEMGQRFLETEHERTRSAIQTLGK